MNAKKYLPFILVIVVAVVFVGGVFLIRKINQPVATDNSSQNDSAVPDLPASERPITALIPSSDGHYLSLKVKGINVPGAISMDYELLYKANNGVAVTTQGVPGTVQLNGQTNVNKDSILLGSESSGKIRFDKGVETGTLTLRFRDGSGKLLGKVMTDFHLQNGTTQLSSVDGSFKYTLNVLPDSTVWFVTMQPFGTPDSSSVVVFQNGWAVYASDGLPHAGNVG